MFKYGAKQDYKDEAAAESAAKAWVMAERQRQRLAWYEFNLMNAGTNGACAASAATQSTNRACGASASTRDSRIASFQSIAGILTGRAAQ